jgi:hypothetical protein
MRNYNINLADDTKEIYSGHIKLGGTNPKGDKINFTNYYMKVNDKPFFGICGEFHYSRYDERLWEDEIIKMKMCGINIIATYIFWIHHEEEQGMFDWAGSKNLRHFIELCGKHGIYVIVRIGPFDHGEVRNGGMPDWLFGRPFDVRSNDGEYLFYVKRLYNEIGKQVKGLLFKDGGPIIGTQIENEYMHSAAPWEITTGVSNEWLAGGHDGEVHMKKLKSIALEAGIDTPIYTCTAWGGAAAPTDEMLPLWGGYAFWPWIFYGDVKEHPATPEYIFRDYHNNDFPKCYNYDPKYEPEKYPYACCEMGGGMTVFYKYRFILPPESVPAMTGIKVAGGCNFIGYYMFHGGSNPKGKRIPFLNENAAPKISYDFQAALGEYGQVRQSYKALKLQHYFFKDFEEVLCNLKTVLPNSTENMDPNDLETLRYAARVKDGSGFIFINNYQDHVETKEQKDFIINVKLKNEEIYFPEKGELNLGKDSYCILPFNLNIEGAILKYSTTQLITALDYKDERYYFFFMPEGMKAEYCFSAEGVMEAEVDKGDVETFDKKVIIKVEENCISNIRIITSSGKKANICTLTSKESLNLWRTRVWGRDRVIITEGNLIATDNDVKLECVDKENLSFSVFPSVEGDVSARGAELVKKGTEGLFTAYEMKIPVNKAGLQLTKVNDSKAVINFSESAFQDVKEVLLRIEYAGDIGYAFIDGELINDNFSNGAPWEIGLKRFEKELIEKGMYIYISPIKKGSQVKSDSTMAARQEIAGIEIAEINSIKAVPVYEVSLRQQ